jgi:transcriptional regulator with AAA-type ATPase domain
VGASAQFEIHDAPSLSDLPALARLMAYRWPGNVRELKNLVERSLYR